MRDRDKKTAGLIVFFVASVLLVAAIMSCETISKMSDEERLATAGKALEAVKTAAELYDMLKGKSTIEMQLALGEADNMVTAQARGNTDPEPVRYWRYGDNVIYSQGGVVIDVREAYGD